MTSGLFFTGTTPAPTVSTASDWVRNPVWPVLTPPLATEQKIVGLHAVWAGDGVGKGGNFFAFSGQGAYTIDYGDGTITNYASNSRADYEFDFNDPQLAGTNAPVTFSVTSNLVNRTAHGLSNGAAIKFYNLASTTGIIAERTYYVINASANTFQVADTAGGSAIDLTGSDGSATLLPYKVAVVTITPQSGQNLTLANFFQKNGKTGLANGYSTGWLDIAMSVPNVSGYNLIIGGYPTVAHGLLERINLVATGLLEYMSELFRNCYALQSLPNMLDITSVTNMGSMFQDCHSLQTFPPFKGSAANVTNMNAMFCNCYNLHTIPPFPGSTGSVTNMSFMFINCYDLQTIPPFPTSVANLTTISAMFNTCYNLQTIPPWPSNLTSLTNVYRAFNECYSLNAIPPMDTSRVADGSFYLGFTYGSITRIQAYGQRYSFSVEYQKLSANALNEIFTGLGTVTGQSITVTGNYGIFEAGYNASIATAKGWTVLA